MPGNVVKKGDIVLKEKQKDEGRKGGKLASRYNESTLYSAGHTPKC